MNCLAVAKGLEGFGIRMVNLLWECVRNGIDEKNGGVVYRLCMEGVEKGGDIKFYVISPMEVHGDGTSSRRSRSRTLVRLNVESLIEEKMYVMFSKKLDKRESLEEGLLDVEGIKLGKGLEAMIGKKGEGDACTSRQLERFLRRIACISWLSNRWLSMKKDVASCGSKYLAYSRVEIEYQGSSGLLLQPELPKTSRVDFRVLMPQVVKSRDEIFSRWGYCDNHDLSRSFVKLFVKLLLESFGKLSKSEASLRILGLREVVDWTARIAIGVRPPYFVYVVAWILSNVI
ncbi:hypothetical protein Tco_1312013 [Tanacetum coccineum]